MSGKQNAYNPKNQMHEQMIHQNGTFVKTMTKGVISDLNNSGLTYQKQADVKVRSKFRRILIFLNK